MFNVYNTYIPSSTVSTWGTFNSTVKIIVITITITVLTIVLHTKKQS